MDSFIAFVTGHEAVLAGVAVAVLDFLFALAPSIESNGILHWVYNTLKGLVAPKAS